MESAERDRTAYAVARAYLLGFASSGVTEELLGHYLNPEPLSMRKPTLPEVYRMLLLSATNRGMGPGVIGRAIGNGDALATILCDFEPGAVARKYGRDWERVLEDIKTELQPRGELRCTPRSFWPLFCRTITSGAAFLSEFADAEAFYEWGERLVSDPRSRLALPLLLSYEIEGFGFALACDFLKDQGYLDFAKPDTHLRRIFTALSLADSDRDYDIFRAAVRIARHQGVTPFHVDKLFWLVGSGYFYDHPHLGKNGRIATNVEQFIKEAPEALRSR